MIIQSFDEVTIKALATNLPKVPRVWLVEPREAARLDSAGQAEGDRRLGDRHRAEQGDHVGEAGDRRLGPRRGADGDARGPSATAAVGATFASVRDEMATFLYTIGVDAVFTDNPDQFPRR